MRHFARHGVGLTFDAQLGITGYGYAPGGIDPDGLRWTGAHGVDERMPVATLVRAARSSRPSRSPCDVRARR